MDRPTSDPPSDQEAIELRIERGSKDAPDVLQGFFGGIFSIPPMAGRLPSGRFAARGGPQGALCRLSWTETVGLLRSQTAASAQGYDQIAIWACLEGGWRLTSPFGQTTLEAGGFAVLDLAEPVDAHPTAQNGEDLLFFGPRLGFGGDGAALISVSGRVFPPDGGPVGLLSAAFDWAAANLEFASASDFAQTIRLLTGLSAASLSIVDSHAHAAGRQRTPALARARAFIDAHLSSRELNPEMIAGTVGVSRARLYRLFEPYGGISSYIRRRRLGRIHADLLRLDLADVATARLALRWGFGSPSAFEKAFKETYGVTSAAHRKGLIASLAQAIQTESTPSLSALIRQMT